MDQEIKMLGLDWARLHFTENRGAAFGMEIGGKYGKLLLSLFRIVAVIIMFRFLRMFLREKVHFGFTIALGLIMAGAIGNILDSIFYGMIFTESLRHARNIAEVVPWGQGYAPLLHGWVVDMFYFPLVQGVYPSWFPIIGDRPFTFFGPIFNVADSAISIGVVSIFIFQRPFFRSYNEVAKKVNSRVSGAAPVAVAGEVLANETANEDTPPPITEEE